MEPEKRSNEAVDLETVKLDGQSDDVVLYQYRDAQGRDVVTNDLASVPKGTRLEPVSDGAEQVLAPSVPEELYGIHISSAVLGLAVGLGVALLPRVFTRARWLGRIALVGSAVVILGSLYFGWVLRTAGFEQHGIVADPREAVNEATRARDVANERSKRIEQLSDQLEK